MKLKDHYFNLKITPMFQLYISLDQMDDRKQYTMLSKTTTEDMFRWSSYISLLVPYKDPVIYGKVEVCKVTSQGDMYGLWVVWTLVVLIFLFRIFKIGKTSRIQMYAWGSSTLDLIMITLFRNCKFQ